MNDHVGRMLRDAQDRIHDADILSESLLAVSTSGSLLRILALEVLLKAANLVALGKYRRSHRYALLWADLPPTSKARILSIAEQRFPGHTNFSDIDIAFDDWEYAFTTGRYYFELYETHTKEEQRAIGDLWISLGAPEDEAVVRFHPFELMALSEGLVRYIEQACPP
jgi:hypothetical protein